MIADICLNVDYHQLFKGKQITPTEPQALFTAV